MEYFYQTKKKQKNRKLMQNSFKQKITKIIPENIPQTKNYKKITQNLHISQLYPKFALRNARNALAGPIAQLVRAPDS